MLERAEFRNLFSGNKTAFGRFVPSGEKDANGKAKGMYSTASRGATESDYDKHLDGDIGMGIIPINEQNTCNFLVIDIDAYDGSADTVVPVVFEYNLPFVAFRSKSGGVHLYMFFSSPVLAMDAAKLGHAYKTALGLGEKTEVFPKQRALKPGETGNWINIPYFGGDATERYAYGADLKALSIAQFIDYAKDKRTDYDLAKRILDELPLNDAPPCLQGMFIRSNVQNNRNNYMFSIAVYYKAKYGDSFDEYVLEANRRLPEPLPVVEVVNTVIKSHTKRQYSYKCAEEPLCSLCKKQICASRKYGIGGDFISSVNFGTFTQFDSDPPYYEWEVNGKRLAFYSEDDLINQNAFRRQCFRLLHVLPNKLSDPVWVGIINTALAEVQVQAMEGEDMISEGAEFMRHLTEFLTGRAKATALDQILMHKVFFRDEKEYVFRGQDLVDFLIKQREFKAYGRTEVFKRIRDLGGKSAVIRINNANPSARVFVLPMYALNGYMEDRTAVADLSYMEPIKPADNEDY